MYYLLYLAIEVIEAFSVSKHSGCGTEKNAMSFQYEELKQR